MEEKAIRMTLYFILACSSEHRKTINSCIKQSKLFVWMARDDKKKLDHLMDLFPEKHPARLIYNEIRNRKDLLQLLENSRDKFQKTKIKNNCLKSCKDDEDVIKISKQIANQK